MKHNKNPYQTISQFAELCGTTRQTLQYYDKIGLLHPMHTGAQGYRYYDSIQRYDFQLISTLKQSGCSLDEIKDIIGKGREQIVQVLSDKRQQLDLESRRIGTYRVFLDYTISFLKLIIKNIEDQPRLIEINHFVGIIKYLLKKPTELGSSDMAAELLDFNLFCSTNDSIQQYPFGYVIPEEEMLNRRRRPTQIICMCHYYDSQSIPEIVPQGRYIMLQKNTYMKFHDDRFEAYNMIEDFMRANKMKVCGDSYEVPADMPEFLRYADHFHVLFLVPVKNDVE